MRLIRPHGRSLVAAGAGARRVLVTKANAQTDIAAFAASDPAVVIGQFAAMLDRVWRKPLKRTEVPSPALRNQREALGQALWRHLELAERFRPVWLARVHPYPATGRRVWQADDPDAWRGRWHDRFNADRRSPQQLAQAIANHLRHRALTASPRRANTETDDTAPRPGLIAQRAASIAANTLLHAHAKVTTLSDKAWAAYRADLLMKDIVAAWARAEAEAEAADPPRHHGKPRWSDIAACLYTHYARVFGPDMPAKELAEDGDPRFAVHQAVKDYWRRALKESAASAEKLRRSMPKDGTALRRVVDARQANRQRMAETRKGKIIHAQACADGDGPAKSWPDPAAVQDGAFWGSDGQTRIKQDEALVRVWRRALALAQRSLTDWCYPDGDDPDDILHIFPPPAGDADKTRLLFGADADLFGGADATSRARQTVKALRNAIFHFKRLPLVLKELEKGANAAERQLWQRDQERRADLPRQMLEAVEAQHFLSPDLLARVMGEADKTSDLPLPRFNRVVARGAGTVPSFPLAPVNRRKMEDDPALRCRYVVVKLVYETGFRSWLDNVPTATLRAVLDDAIGRTDQAARDINGRHGPDGVEITSRAAKLLGGGTDFPTLAQLVERLTAETATEMRVQAGYHHDGDKARDQARFIDALLCDVLARLLCVFLAEAGLEGLGRIGARRDWPAAFPPPAGRADIGPAWGPRLYAMVHLIPADDAGLLLHQLRRWKAARGDRPAHDVAQIIDVLSLYLDCHDAKFSGGALHGGLDWHDWSALFADRDCFYRVFPPQTNGRHVPLRGLREVRRFGGLAPLRAIVGTNPIRSAEVSTWERQNQTIADYQARREELHDLIARQGSDWAKLPQRRRRDDLTEYSRLVEAIARNRHLTARVTLGDVVRLHRLMMAVWARLLDFSGLWERDLYFRTLAAMGADDHAALSKEQRHWLDEGQIVPFCDQRNASPANKGTRNNLAHFNMLRHGRVPDLTQAVNDTRRLMAYDRKLKNAVSLAVKDILARDGIDIRWTMDDDHQLRVRTVTARRAEHLPGKHWQTSGVTPPIDALAGDGFLDWVWVLFGGGGPRPPCQDENRHRAKK